METIKLISKGATNLYQNKKQFYALNFKAKSITRDVMNEFLTDLSKDINKRGISGTLYVNTYYKWRSQYRTSKPFAIGTDIRVHDVQEYDEDFAKKQDADARFSNFTVYFSKEGIRAGGCDSETNDCLYRCLCQYYGGYANFPKSNIKTKSKLKRYLGLERNDKIGLDKLQKLADYLKLNFAVSGDFEMLTTGEYYNTISISLKNEHYTILSEEKVKAKFLHKSKEKLLMYTKISKNNNETYDVERGYRQNISDVEIIEEKFNHKSDYTMVEIKSYDLKSTLQEEHDKFKTIAEELKTQYKGLINLFNFGNNYSTLAKHLFNTLCKEVIDAEPIGQKEADWIKVLGGLIYHKPYEGDAWCYDINSSYAFEMSKYTNIFPVSTPEFKIVSSQIFDEHGYYPYGIFRAKVLYDTNNPNHHFFRFNRENKYTHIDLTLARHLQLPIEIIQDGEHNAMLYSGKKITGKKLFGNVIDKLFEIQESGLSKEARTIVKRIRNSLWGALCQRKKILSKINKEGNIIVPSDTTLTHINDKYVVAINNENQFETNYARIGVFLTGMARRAIFRYVEPHKEYCVRIHTDSMTLTKNVEIKTSGNIGELKLEKQGHLKIVSINDCKFN